MNTHSFATSVAQKLGVERALLLQHFYYWHQRNQANNEHYHDNRYWFYQTARGFTEIFPYFSESQISRLLKSLVEDGYIAQGNYNRIKFDRTKWYALRSEGLRIFENREMEVTKPSVLNSRNRQTYTNIANIPTSKEKEDSKDVKAVEVVNSDSSLALQKKFQQGSPGSFGAVSCSPCSASLLNFYNLITTAHGYEARGVPPWLIPAINSAIAEVGLEQLVTICEHYNKHDDFRSTSPSAFFKFADYQKVLTVLLEQKASRVKRKRVKEAEKMENEKVLESIATPDEIKAIVSENLKWKR